MRPFFALASAAAVLAALASGCGSEPDVPVQYGGYRRTGAANPYAYYGYGYQSQGSGRSQAQSPDPSSTTSSSVHIEDKILKACGDLPTAHFAFDSTSVLPDSATALDALARCFVSGPLHGRSLKLIGHADPRGETEYNLGLGHQRAYSVVDILAQRGIELSRMTTSSKGEFDATGSDEEGWARDRRVDVLLAD